MRVHVEATSGPTSGQNDIEIVERKGLGHPDTICDLVMERISQALAKAYLDQFSRILHYNCDKGLLVAGPAQRRRGGGRIIDPMRLVIGIERRSCENSMLLKSPLRLPKTGFGKIFRKLTPTVISRTRLS